MEVPGGHTSTTHSPRLVETNVGSQNMQEMNTSPSTPPVDITSSKGMFGWAIVDGINIPQIYRNDNTFVPVRVVEHKFMSKYLKACPEFLESRARLISHYITEAEATLLTEINNSHCAGEYGEQPFVQLDLIVKLSDFETYYAKLKKYYFDLINKSDSKKGIFDVHGGWIQMNHTVTPYILRRGVQFVPLPVVKFAAHLLTDSRLQGDVVTPPEQNYLNHSCKEAGLHFEFNKKTELIPLPLVVAFSKAKIRVQDLPANNPFMHADYPSSDPVKTEKAKARTHCDMNAKKLRFIQPKMPVNPTKSIPQISSRLLRQTPNKQRFALNGGALIRQNSCFTSTQMTSNNNDSALFTKAEGSHCQRADSCPPLVVCTTLPPQVVPIRDSRSESPQMTKSDEQPLDLTMGASRKTKHNAGIDRGRDFSDPVFRGSELIAGSRTGRNDSTSQSICRFNTSGVMRKGSQSSESSCASSDSMDRMRVSSTIESNPASPRNSLDGSPCSEKSWKESEQLEAETVITRNDQIAPANHLNIQRVKFNEKVISVLSRNGESLVLLELVSKLYFPDWEFENFHYTLGEVIGIDVLTLKPEEEQAFINYYSLRTDSLECNKAVRLNDLKQRMHPLLYIYQAKVLKLKMNKESSGASLKRPRTNMETIGHLKRMKKGLENTLERLKEFHVPK